MSSSSDPLQNSFDSYEPKQELESPFLNEEYLADEARIAQWRVPVPGVQLESPFLEAFEDGWSSGEVEEFEEEAINEYKSNEKHFITHERLEELQISNSKLPIKEVIYVRGKWNDNKLDLDPWKWAHPRKPRSNTALSLFDYDLGKHKRWDNWDGTLPPTPAPNNESAITSVLDLYAFIKALPSGSVEELHFFTHGWRGGPTLFNTFDRETDPNKRDSNDQDPRIKDFKDPSVLGGVEGQKFKTAFSPSALVKLWGCTYEQSYRDLIRGFFKQETTNTKKQKEKIIKDYQDGISWTYQFVLHQAIDIPVYAAPLGYGADPSLPFGIDGDRAMNLVDKKQVKYRGMWPPKKGNQWWRISAFFGSDKGRYFYKKVLGANLDILDYVAYTKTLVDPALQKNIIVKELFINEEEVVETQEFEKIFDGWDQEELEEFEKEIEEEEETTTGKSENEFEDCSNAQKIEIQKAFERAMRAVRYAETFIGSAYGRPEKMSTKTRKLLHEHFHTTDHDDLREIFSKLVSIRHAFEKGISFECEKECETRILGYTYNTQWFGGHGNVHICFDTRSGGGDFAKKSLKLQKAIVIHEVGYRYVGLDDNAYLHEKKYRMLSSKQAIDNADSYAGFVVDLYQFSTKLSSKLLNELAYDNYIEEFEEDMEDLEYYDEESNWQIEQQAAELRTPKSNLHDIITQDISMHVYFHEISESFTVESFFNWVVGSSPNESQPNRFQLAGAEINLINNSKTAVSDFKRSLKTPGAVVVYFGHTISRNVSGRMTTWGLVPSGPLSKKPDITCLELTKILSAAKAKIVVLAGCATIQCVTKIKGDTVVIVTKSGHDRGTNALVWAPAIKALLDELLDGGTIGDAFIAANKSFAKGSSTDSFKMISGDSTLKM
jgi:Lysine-specific metallo-endopeptidase